MIDGKTNCAEFLNDGMFIDDLIFFETILPNASLMLMVSVSFIVVIDLSILETAVISSSAEGSKSLMQLFLVFLFMRFFTIIFKS